MTRDRNAMIRRHWRILAALIEAGRSGTNLHALAAQLGVSTRTMRRDIAAMEEAHVPLYIVDGDTDGRHPMRIYFMPGASCPVCGARAAKRQEAA